MKRYWSVLLAFILGCVLIAPTSAAAAAGDPFGNFERASAVDGGIEVKGWAIDPDTTAPIYVWVTLDGAGRHLNANLSRPDVAAAYPDAGPNHGFATTLAAEPGAHRVCVTASNVGPGSHKSLACRDVTLPDDSPFGNVERATGVVGGIELKGWAIDPDTTAPIYMWVTLDGAGRHLYANLSRPDVAAAYPDAGPNHGFATTLAAEPGAHRVCVTASNVGPGSHKSLGCHIVTVPDASPFGNFERASAVDGGIEVKGWAIDPDTTAPIYVWVTLDGAGVHLSANRARPDVATRYPASGPNHGFLGTVNASPGTHRVCVTAANVGPGAHRSLGCRDVTLGAVVDVYFMHEARFADGIEPYTEAVQRTVSPASPATGALQALFAGPTAAEQSRSLRAVLSEATGFTDLTISNGIARVRLTGGCDSQGSTFTIQQLITPTLKQFATVDYVKVYSPDGQTGSPDGPSDSLPECLNP